MSDNYSEDEMKWAELQELAVRAAILADEIEILELEELLGLS